MVLITPPGPAHGLVVITPGPGHTRSWSSLVLRTSRLAVRRGFGQERVLVATRLWSRQTSGSDEALLATKSIARVSCRGPFFVGLVVVGELHPEEGLDAFVEVEAFAAPAGQDSAGVGMVESVYRVDDGGVVGVLAGGLFGE